MKVLLAVIEDLCIFAYRAISGALPYTPSNASGVSPASTSTMQIRHSSPVAPKSPDATAVSTEHSITSAVGTQQDNAGTLKTGYQYFIGVPDTYFYQDPVLAFDGALQALPYGTSVRLVALQGRWAQVRLAGRLGWIFKDVLYEDANSVYPRFVVGGCYGAYNVETVKLRRCIGDIFGGGRGSFSLLAPEYIQYKLQQKHRTIQWGDIRQRIAGTWQRKLKGNKGVHIGITPKTNSVMEYMIDDFGYQAFVEAVFPDDSIHITQIGKGDTSQYIDEMLNSSQWKELRPVFIDVL